MQYNTARYVVPPGGKYLPRTRAAMCVALLQQTGAPALDLDVKAHMPHVSYQMATGIVREAARRARDYGYLLRENVKFNSFKLLRDPSRNKRLP